LRGPYSRRSRGPTRTKSSTASWYNIFGRWSYLLRLCNWSTCVHHRATPCGTRLVLQWVSTPGLGTCCLWWHAQQQHLAGTFGYVCMLRRCMHGHSGSWPCVLSFRVFHLPCAHMQSCCLMCRMLLCHRCWSSQFTGGALHSRSFPHTFERLACDPASSECLQ
jgi:hypothetical protein